MENIHDLAITIRDEVLIYHFEYYLGFRKSPNAHLPNVDYEEEEKQPEVVDTTHRKSGGGVPGNKFSPNKKERSTSPGPGCTSLNEKKERKSSGKKIPEAKKEEKSEISLRKTLANFFNRRRMWNAITIAKTIKRNSLLYFLFFTIMLCIIFERNKFDRDLFNLTGNTLNTR